ncbi:MAG: aldo/keto reductase [Phycisphaerae bacterium]|nr:aldo/keto reductase [Phycisphaerae bacterium]
MNYRTLGKTDIRVSVICQGCWSIVGKDFTWGHTDAADAIAALRASFEAGVNFFDTAPAYGDGESEELLRRALKDVRKDVIIATKASPGNFSPDKLRASCETSLRRLGTDYIDLYQLHWPSPEIPLTETWGAMEELRAEGKIRAAGVSNFGVSYLADLPAGAVSNQLPYSLLWRAIEYDVQPACVERGMGILCYSSLAQSLLTGKFASAADVPDGRARSRLFASTREGSRHGQAGCEEDVFGALGRIRAVAAELRRPMGHVALAWLLGREGVTSAVVGARNARQARDNANAAELTLDEATLKALSDATEAVKRHIGANADMWQSDTRLEKRFSRNGVV